MAKKIEATQVPTAVEHNSLVDLDLDLSITAASTGSERKTRGGSTNTVSTYWSATRCPTCYY